jgi:hypothetical protein
MGGARDRISICPAINKAQIGHRAVVNGMSNPSSRDATNN